MKKNELNNLRVAAPCPMKWENMLGDERVRFCQSCQLNVYNFSEMTKSEIEKTILQKEGAICGKLYRKADGTILTKNCPMGLQAARQRVSRTITAVFATVMSLCSIVYGQTEKEKSCKIVSQGKVKRIEAKSDLVTIKGVITDLNGAVIPNAEIILSNEKKKEFKTNTNDEGEFKLKDLPDGNYSVKFFAPNFKEYKIKTLQLNKKENLKFEISLKLDGVELLGVIVEEPLIDISSSGLTYRISGDMIRKLPLKK